MHVITWIAGVETIKRQTWAACGCLAARSEVPCVRGLAYTAYRLHARFVCDVQRFTFCLAENWREGLFPRRSVKRPVYVSFTRWRG